MDTREQILVETRKLLSRIGPLSMTMDMIARTCGISKRTLYEKFPDKQTLIDEVVARENEDTGCEMRRIFEEAPNCFEALFGVFMKVREFLQTTSLTFMEEIKRLYPEVHARHTHNEKEMIMQLSKLLQKAQQEGHVIADVDTLTASFLFLSTMRNIHNSERMQEFGFDRVRVFEAAFLNFLRGIATIDGINYIEEMLRRHANDKTMKNEIGQ